MIPRKIILSLASIIMIVACTNNSELVKDMTSNKKDIPAVDEKLGLNRNQDSATFRLFAPAEETNKK